MNWERLQTVGSWCGSHSNKLSTAGRAFYLMAAGLGWTHLTLTQFALVGGFFEALFAVFIESTTVSKNRVGERIDAEVTKITGTGSGMFKAPPSN